MVPSENKTAEIEDLFSAIREACAPKLWSRGIELSRRSTVAQEEGEDERIILRLTEEGQTLARVVTFWPEEGDWHCDCAEKEDPCLHVVASAIHFKQAQDKGLSIPLIRQTQHRVVYRFSRKAGFLYFERMLVNETGKSFRLTSSLMALVMGRVPGPKISPTKEDVAVDLLLKDFQSGLVPLPFMPKLLSELVNCTEISLDGQKVECDRERTGFIACVEDAPGAGIRLFGMQDPTIRETFRNGAALCEGAKLRPFGHGKLQPEEIKMLAEGRYFAPRDFPELVSELLPALEQKLTIRIHAKSLPQQIRVSPRLVIDIQRNNETLILHPLIVYGDPAIAQVEHGHLDVFGLQIPIRDEKEERRLQSLLQRDLSMLPLDAKVEFKGEHAVAVTESLQNWTAGELRGDSLDAFRKHSALLPQIDLQCKNDSASFDLSFKTAQGAKVHASTVIQAWKQGQQLVPLLDGGYAPLPMQWLERYGDILREVLATRGESKELHPALLADVSDLCESLDFVTPKSFQDLQKQFEASSFHPEVDLPSDLQATLRSYQEEGVAWLNFLRKQGFGALLADDMGLGKTLQAICILRKKSLVVAPTSVLYNWEREIKRFRPSLKVCVYHGQRRMLDETADVVLTTYALLRLDEDKLLHRTWTVAVLDEAQNIKNPDSQVAKVAFSIQSAFKLTLTGTPIENSLEDIWSQFHFLNPSILGSRKSFLENYSKPILQGDDPMLARLRRRLKPFILRRLKTEVAKELPPRSEVVLYCELNDEERTVYDSFLNSSRTDILEKLNQGQSLFQVLEVLLRLRQSSCHLGLIPGQVADTSSKVERLIACLKESVSEGHKALIFSQWTSLLGLIAIALEREQIRFDRIDGSTRDRSAVVDRFQTDKGLPVLLLSLKAAGTGLNLTAADHVFIVDPWWNPAIEEQAADRVYRIGQDKPVMVYRLVAKDTVEERILLLKEKKRSLANAVVEVSTENFKITREDLLTLFEDGV